MAKRGIATITIYVYGDTNQEQIDDAKKVVKLINDKYDCRASIEGLNTAPYGEIGTSKKINLNKLKL